MNSRYVPGTVVRVTAADPPVHCRAPRYVRGHLGTVVGTHGNHRLPDHVVAGVRPVVTETVYAVSFPARDLWGEGDHWVIVDLWESYLSPADRLSPTDRDQARR